MAAAVTVSNSAPYVAATVSGTGFTASTDYVASVLDPSGHARTVYLRTDGAGAFSFTHVPQTPGATTVSVRPLAEFRGTTTATATATHNSK